MRFAYASGPAMAPGAVALLLLAALGCGGSGGPSGQDAGEDAPGAVDVGPQDRPRPHPDVPPVPGLTVSVDGVPWYVLNGSISYSPAQSMVYITAMVSCDECIDVSQFLISLASPATNDCGPSDDTITFTRTSLSTHPFRSATGTGCGFQVSEAGGDESVRAVGSFSGVVRNIDTSITVTYTLGIDFDLAIGTSFP